MAVEETSNFNSDQVARIFRQLAELPEKLGQLASDHGVSVNFSGLNCRNAGFCSTECRPNPCEQPY